MQGHPKIYACFPIPVFEDKWGITDSVIRKQIIPVIKRLSRKTKSKIIDLYTPFLGKSNLISDGVHPNAAGAAFLANEVFKALHQ